MVSMRKLLHMHHAITYFFVHHALLYCCRDFFYATFLGGRGHQETYFLWPYYRPHLSQFWKKVIFAIQLGHFLLMHLPYKAFQLELPEMNCHIFVKLNVV